MLKGLCFQTCVICIENKCAFVFIYEDLYNEMFSRTKCNMGYYLSPTNKNDFAKTNRSPLLLDYRYLNFGLGMCNRFLSYFAVTLFCI